MKKACRLTAFCLPAHGRPCGSRPSEGISPANFPAMLPSRQRHEPAAHRNERRRRSDARTLTRVAAAGRLIGGHHSAQPRATYADIVRGNDKSGYGAQQGQSKPYTCCSSCGGWAWDWRIRKRGGFCECGCKLNTWSSSNGHGEDVLAQAADNVPMRNPAIPTAEVEHILQAVQGLNADWGPALRALLELVMPKPAAAIEEAPTQAAPSKRLQDTRVFFSNKQLRRAAQRPSWQLRAKPCRRQKKRPRQTRRSLTTASESCKLRF